MKPPFCGVFFSDAYFKPAGQPILSHDHTQTATSWMKLGDSHLRPQERGVDVIEAGDDAQLLDGAQVREALLRLAITHRRRVHAVQLHIVDWQPVCCAEFGAATI